jgi:uncharacterized protein
MKYLILLAVVLAVVWYWRRGQSSTPQRRNAAKPDASPQDMVECPVCRIHLPRSDALPGPDGQLYCCTEHRARSGN